MRDRVLIVLLLASLRTVSAITSTVVAIGGQQQLTMRALLVMAFAGSASASASLSPAPSPPPRAPVQDLFTLDFEGCPGSGVGADGSAISYELTDSLPEAIRFSRRPWTTSTWSSVHPGGNCHSNCFTIPHPGVTQG